MREFDAERHRRAAADGGDTRDDEGDRVEKKEKVLHTRIPGSLDREIKRRARHLGMSVSTVVRNVLLHTFDLVEDMVTDGTNLALSLTGSEAPARDKAARAQPYDGEVLGWQEAILNRNAVCDRCNAILAKGTGAAIGIPEGEGPRPVICTTCLAAIGRTRTPHDKESES